MGKKTYVGAAMLEAGRFCEFIKGLPSETVSAATSRVDALVADNPEYCDVANDTVDDNASYTWSSAAPNGTCSPPSCIFPMLCALPCR